jgi:hypothetical protein
MRGSADDLAGSIPAPAIFSDKDNAHHNRAVAN